MRRPLTLVSLAVLLVFVANSALAQKKPKGKKKTDGPSAAETWTDPVEKEQSDKGPYTPHKDEADEPKPVPKSERAPDKGRKRDKIQVFGQLVIGFGGAPLNQPSYAPGGKGTALGFQLGGRYDITPAFSGGLRIPLTTATVKQTSGASIGTNLTTTAFGSPELFGEYRLSLSRLTTVPIGFGVGIPVAQGNPDETGTDTSGHAANYVNQLADATTGWRDSELFQPKRLPIVVGAGIHHDRHDWELHADAKFVLLPALSTTVSVPPTQPPNAGAYKINGFALREVTTLGGSYNFLSSPLIYAGLDLAFIWSPMQTFIWEAQGANAKPTTLQAVLEPRVGARFGHVSPSIGYIAPLGGRLGDAGAGGIRLHVDAFF
jgi:hypothetical protein